MLYFRLSREHIAEATQLPSKPGDTRQPCLIYDSFGPVRQGNCPLVSIESNWWSNLHHRCVRIRVHLTNKLSYRCVKCDCTSFRNNQLPERPSWGTPGDITAMVVPRHAYTSRSVSELEWVSYGTRKALTHSMWNMNGPKARPCSINVKVMSIRYGIVLKTIGV